ncbi:MAG: DNA repair protein RadC [Cyclobacteriaceae bacterium]|nr:MAG: DNA repair protein RadC [Cyclobacteriaceae bacterium]
MKYSKLPISQWAKDDRPREKLIKIGVGNLSDAELVATLIGSGNGQHNALDLARQILMSVNHSLDQLGSLEYQDLIRFPGIGDAKAIVLLSAMELGRRRSSCVPTTRFKISGSQQVYKLMQPKLLDKKMEMFWVVYLNRAHMVINSQQISQGGVSGTLVDPRLIFKHALNHLASAIILVHNHPSGQLSPSQADIGLTKKLLNAGKLMEIPVLDHLIFTNSGYFSFADEGLL